MCRVNLVDFLIACYQPASASVVSLHGRARADSHDRHRSNLRQEMHLKRSLNSRLRQIVHSESSVYSILHQPASCARHQHTPTHRDPATLAPPRSFHETYASTDRPSERRSALSAFAAALECAIPCTSTHAAHSSYPLGLAGLVPVNASGRSA
jgi:hypothetical protein